MGCAAGKEKTQHKIIAKNPSSNNLEGQVLNRRKNQTSQQILPNNQKDISEVRIEKQQQNLEQRRQQVKQGLQLEQNKQQKVNENIEQCLGVQKKKELIEYNNEDENKQVNEGQKSKQRQFVEGIFENNSVNKVVKQFEIDEWINNNQKQENTIDKYLQQLNQDLYQQNLKFQSYLIKIPDIKVKIY